MTTLPYDPLRLRNRNTPFAQAPKIAQPAMPAPPIDQGAPGMQFAANAARLSALPPFASGVQPVPAGPLGPPVPGSPMAPSTPGFSAPGMATTARGNIPGVMYGANGAPLPSLINGQSTFSAPGIMPGSQPVQQPVATPDYEGMAASLNADRQGQIAGNEFAATNIHNTVPGVPQAEAMTAGLQANNNASQLKTLQHQYEVADKARAVAEKALADFSSRGEVAKTTTEAADVRNARDNQTKVDVAKANAKQPAAAKSYNIPPTLYAQFSPELKKIVDGAIAAAANAAAGETTPPPAVNQLPPGGGGALGIPAPAPGMPATQTDTFKPVGTPAPATQPTAQQTISQAEYDSLPPGASYQAPDGTMRTKR